MGHVSTQLVLKNLYDIIRAKKGELPEQEIRQATVTSMVDTGATTLVINKKLFDTLGLEALDEREITYANNSKDKCKLTEPVGIFCNNRFTAASALVVEDAPEVLLGVLPLEGMDLVVDTVNQKLVGAHGDEVVYLA